LARTEVEYRVLKTACLRWGNDHCDRNHVQSAATWPYENAACYEHRVDGGSKIVGLLSPRHRGLDPSDSERHWQARLRGIHASRSRADLARLTPPGLWPVVSGRRESGRGTAWCNARPPSYATRRRLTRERRQPDTPVAFFGASDRNVAPAT